MTSCGIPHALFAQTAAMVWWTWCISGPIRSCSVDGITVSRCGRDVPAATSSSSASRSSRRKMDGSGILNITAAGSAAKAWIHPVSTDQYLILKQHQQNYEEEKI
ncbi:hypothetical protein CHARACLAT_020914 [Characodon lateralis]|uniref:Secreted protein n=1 Tax=Characodon lateralis TaxID=208331 RepID=A0ABU7EVJ4_9TELE|nr:hypothetical protein [Characodon lateralis]